MKAIVFIFEMYIFNLFSVCYTNLSLLPISSFVKSGDSRSSSHTLTPHCYQALRDIGAETGNLFKNTLILKEKSIEVYTYSI